MLRKSWPPVHFQVSPWYPRNDSSRLLANIQPKSMIYMVVSWNRGTPKWLVYKGKPYYIWMILGYPYISGNHHMNLWIFSFVSFPFLLKILEIFKHGPASLIHWPFRMVAGHNGIALPLQSSLSFAEAVEPPVVHRLQRHASNDLQWSPMNLCNYNGMEINGINGIQILS